MWHERYDYVCRTDDSNVGDVIVTPFFGVRQIQMKWNTIVLKLNIYDLCAFRDGGRMRRNDDDEHKYGRG